MDADERFTIEARGESGEVLLTIVLLLIAVRAIIVGIVDLVIAFRYPDNVRNRTAVIIIGVIALLFGLFLLVLPFIDVGITIAVAVGVYMLFMGFVIAAEGITGRTAEKHAAIDAELEAEFFPDVE